MKIDAGAAVTLAAVIRSDLQSIARIEMHVSQLDLGNLSRAELDSLGFSLHNIYNALENTFKQISLGFENHIRDQSRWHRELLEKMFLDLKPLRPPVRPAEARSVTSDLLGFRHLFRHAYDFKLDEAKTVALWKLWQNDGGQVTQPLSNFADELGSMVP